jgi:putative hemolysin
MELPEPTDLFKDQRPAPANGDYFAKFLMFILRIKKLDKIYEQIVDKRGVEFIDELIKMLEFDIEFDEEQLKKIPKEGPLIIVANHPLGGFDGLLLIKYLSLVRKDVKVLANYLLKKIDAVSEYFMEDNPFDDSEQGTYYGLKEAVTHLNNGGVLCLFPAIDVHTKDPFGGVTDKVWQFPVVNFIKLARVPVVPVLFQGTNSRLLHLVAKINPALKSARLPSEILRKKHKKIKLRIGSPIKVDEQDTYKDVYQLGRFLRAKTYSMESDIEVRRFFNRSGSAGKNSERNSADKIETYPVYA